MEYGRMTPDGQRLRPNSKHPLLRYSHRHCRHPPDNSSISGKAHLPRLICRMGVRYQQESAFARFAPRTGIAVTQFDKVDGAVDFIVPSTAIDLCLIGINLHKGTGTDQRMEREVLSANISIYGFAAIPCAEE